MIRTKRVKVCSLATLIAILAVSICVAPLAGETQNDNEELLSKLMQDPLDRSLITAIENRVPDPGTLASLRTAFNRQASKNNKQRLALTLLRLGDLSEAYFEYLPGFAREAIGDQAPYFAKFDAQGQWVRGAFSNEFESWCSSHGRDPRSLAALQLGAFAEDVLFLAKASDARALQLFRTGLDSKNPGVVGYCVMGLARLHDVSALPAISTAADRIPEAEKLVVASQLPWYSRQEADQLLDRLVPDEAMRTHLREQVNLARSAEQAAAGRRAGRQN